MYIGWSKNLLKGWLDSSFRIHQGWWTDVRCETEVSRITTDQFKNNVHPCD